MKRIILGILALSFFFSFKLNATISSRIEGVVTDEITGLPVEKASVSAYLMLNDRMCAFIWSAETDAKGYFRIVKEFQKGNYFVEIIKEGYRNHGPRLKMKSDSPILDSHDWILPREKINDFVFSLDQGEVRHLKIKLEKESVLKINVYKKMPGDAQPKLTKADISISDRDYDEYFSQQINGEYTSHGFGPNKYQIGIYVKGYVRKVFDNIQLEKGTIKTIEFIADFTSGQVIHGKIRYYYDGKLWAPPSGSVVLQNSFGDVLIDMSSDTRGEYWLGGVEPGIYELTIMLIKSSFVFVDINKKINVNIMPNEKKEFYHKF